MDPNELVFIDGEISAFRLHAGNIAVAQAFLEANPACSQMVAGRPALPDEAAAELTHYPASVRPEDYYFLGLQRAGELVGIASLLRWWPVDRVSFISLFQIAESHHGRGVAQLTYAALERWMVGTFSPMWLRLGVVEVNARGRRFWEREGYHEIEQKKDLTIGHLTHQVTILLKSVGGGDDAAYWSFVSAGSMPKT